ncbi:MULTISPECIES: hypothetical protein [Erwinia]|uniref:Uncharacterized protein n=2 Tax=Erwinia TaxID=551 RepID=A0A014M6D6_9GAMM|nr:hypothetical protein [Erwinia mallotivora]EXU77351.1 hypothetical protein BG55_00305 [Erwinia mallotivora]
MIKNLIFRALMALIIGAFLGWSVGKTSDLLGLHVSFNQIVIGAAIFVVIVDRLILSKTLIGKNTL